MIFEFDDRAFEDMIRKIGDPLPKNKRGFVDKDVLQGGDDFEQNRKARSSRVTVDAIIKKVNQFSAKADLFIAPIAELAIGLNAKNAKTFNECLNQKTPEARMEALKAWAQENQLNSFHNFCEIYNEDMSQALLALTGDNVSNASSDPNRNFNRFLKMLQAMLVEPSLTRDLHTLKEDIKEIRVSSDSTAHEKIVGWKKSLLDYSLDYLKDTYLRWLSELGGQYSARSSVYQEFNRHANRHAKSATVLLSKVFLQSFKGKQLSDEQAKKEFLPAKGKQLSDEQAKKEFLPALSGIYEKNQCVDIQPSDLDFFVKKFASVLGTKSKQFSEPSKSDLLRKAFSALSSNSQKQLKNALLSRAQDTTKQKRIKGYLVATERGSELSVAYSSQSSNPWLIIYPDGNCFGFTMNEVQGKEAQGAKHAIDFDLLYNQNNQAAINERKDSSKGSVIEAQPMIESMLKDLANGDTMTLSFGSSRGRYGHIISLKRIDTKAFTGYEFVDCNNVRIRWNWKPEDAAKYAADHIQAQSYTDPTCYLDLKRFRADANKTVTHRLFRGLSSLLTSTKASPIKNFYKVKTKEVLSCVQSDLESQANGISRFSEIISQTDLNSQTNLNSLMQNYLDAFDRFPYQDLNRLPGQDIFDKIKNAKKPIQLENDEEIELVAQILIKSSVISPNAYSRMGQEKSQLLRETFNKFTSESRLKLREKLMAINEQTHHMGQSKFEKRMRKYYPMMDSSTLYVRYKSRNRNLNNYYGWRKLSDLNLTTNEYGRLLRGETCERKFIEIDKDGKSYEIPVELSHCVAVRNHHHKKSTRAELLVQKGEEVNEADDAAVGKLKDNLSSLKAQSINYEHMDRKYQDAIMAKIEHWFSSEGQAFTADHKQHGKMLEVGTASDLRAMMDDDGSDDEEDDDDTHFDDTHFDPDTIAPQISYQFLSEWCDKIFAHDSKHFLGRLFDACGRAQIGEIKNFKHLQVMLHTTLDAGKKNLCVEYLKYVAEQYPSSRIPGPSSEFYRYLSRFISSLDASDLTLCLKAFKGNSWIFPSIILIKDAKKLKKIFEASPTNEIKNIIVKNWLSKKFGNPDGLSVTVEQLNATSVDYQKLATIFSCTTWDACQQVISEATSVSRRRDQDRPAGQRMSRTRPHRHQQQRPGRNKSLYIKNAKRTPNVAQDLTQSVQCLINKTSNRQVNSLQLQQAIEMVLIQNDATIARELQRKGGAKDKATLLDKVWEKMNPQEKQPFIPRITQLMKQYPSCRAQGTKMILKVNDFDRNVVNTVGADNLFSIFLGALRIEPAFFRTKGESLNAQNPSTKTKHNFLVSMFEKIPQKDRLTCLKCLLQGVASRKQGTPVEKAVLGDLLKQEKHYQQVARVILQSVNVENQSAKKILAFSPDQPFSPDQQGALLKKLKAPPQSTNQPSLLGRAFLVVCNARFRDPQRKNSLLQKVWPNLNQTDQENIKGQIDQDRLKRYGLDEGSGPRNRPPMRPLKGQ